MEEKNKTAQRLCHTFDATALSMSIQKYVKEHLGYPGGLNRLYAAISISAQYVPDLRWLGVPQ